MNKTFKAKGCAKWVLTDDSIIIYQFNIFPKTIPLSKISDASISTGSWKTGNGSIRIEIELKDKYILFFPSDNSTDAKHAFNYIKSKGKDYSKEREEKEAREAMLGRAMLEAMAKPVDNKFKKNVFGDWVVDTSDKQ